MKKVNPQRLEYDSIYMMFLKRQTIQLKEQIYELDYWGWVGWVKKQGLSEIRNGLKGMKEEGVLSSEESN